MKNFDELIGICCSEVRVVGIVPGEIERWEINKRAQSRWGLCRKQKNRLIERNRVYLPHPTHKLY